jgi:trimethylamine--corrinoid protein Co-methyltransferase
MVVELLAFLEWVTGFIGAITMFDLLQGLSEKELDIFHDKVLSVIAKGGIQLRHVDMRKRLADFNGVVIDDDIVKFMPDLVNKHVFDIEFDMPAYFADDNFVMITGTTTPNIRDSETGRKRPSNSEDLIMITKLEDSLDVVGTAAVTVCDVPRHLVDITIHKIMWENSRFKGNDIFEHTPKSTVLPCVRYIEEMAAILDKRFTYGTWVESPKGFNDDELSVLYEYLDRDVPLWVGNFPMYGCTSPIFFESGMVQAAAELFASYLAVKLLHGDYPVYLQVIDSIMGHPVDWKFLSVVFSSTKDILKTIYQVCINNFYHIPNVGMSLLSGGIEPDFQQGLQKGLHTLVAALLGVRAFRIGGMVGIDMVCCPEAVILDHELLRFVRRLITERGFDMSRTHEDRIIGVAPKGSFMMDDLTLEWYKDEYFESELFDCYPIDYWEEKGYPSLLQRARDKMWRKVEEHDYRLPEDQQKELDALYKKAKDDYELQEAFR